MMEKIQIAVLAYRLFLTWFILEYVGVLFGLEFILGLKFKGKSYPLIVAVGSRDQD